MSGGQRLDSGTSRPSARLDAETRAAAIKAMSFVIRHGHSVEDRDGLLEALGAAPTASGGKTDALGGHVFPRHRVVGDDLEETA